MLEISIPIHINFTLNGEVSITNIAEKIHEFQIENQILDEFIQKYDDIIITKLCGEKFKHNKEDEMYKRAGNS
jgi:hypothetical protein